jgi:hypothetical protein
VATFDAAGPFVVKSQDAQHPFYLALYMTGGGGFDGHGDPDFVNVIPPDEFLRSYVFFAPPTYSDANLTVVRRKADDGTFKPVVLDCAGPVVGFQASGQYEVAHVDLVRGSQPQGQCDNGRHEMHSDAPFGVTVWGWDQDSSYAYPAGASAKGISTTVVLPVPK